MTPLSCPAAWYWRLLGRAESGDYDDAERWLDLSDRIMRSRRTRRGVCPSPNLFSSWEPSGVQSVNSCHL